MSRAVRNIPPPTTCPNCGLTYYQTAAPHVCAEWVTKENRTMNESEKFITTGVFSHERNTSGNCSISGCPCRGWSAQEPVNEHEHEPPARAGEDRRDGGKRYLLSEIEHLLTERERLRRVIREEIDAIRAWQHAIHPRSDVQEGLAISLSKLMNAIDQKEGEE